MESKTEINGTANQTLPIGKYTLIGVDVDTTGRRLIDEVIFFFLLNKIQKLIIYKFFFFFRLFIWLLIHQMHNLDNI